MKKSMTLSSKKLIQTKVMPSRTAKMVALTTVSAENMSVFVSLNSQAKAVKYPRLRN